MKVILFGATGMVGQGVLRECLRDARVERVLAIGRTPSGQHPPEAPRSSRTPTSWTSPPWRRSSPGSTPASSAWASPRRACPRQAYRRVTYDCTLAAAEVWRGSIPGMTFLYVSGPGTDSTEQGRTMWARVKGQTENALLRLPFKAVYMFRPGFIQPLHGIRSKTRLYRAFYAVPGPLLPSEAPVPEP